METKTCKSTRTRTGCGIEKPIEEFGISSVNPNTGKKYIKNICKKCEWSTKQVIQPPSSESELYSKLNRIWR